MSEQDRSRWEKKYAERTSRVSSPPSAWLERHLAQLPRGGKALDLACGDGGNALLLASRGFRVTAVDIAKTALEIGKKVAGPLPIQWIEADLDEYQPEPGAFDVVLCMRYLDRRRIGGLVDQALKSQGYVIAETFNRLASAETGCHISNPDYLLEEGEWPKLFAGYEALAHEEKEGISRILARKP